MKRSAWIPAIIAPVIVAGAVAAPALATTGAPSGGTAPSAAQVLASVARSKSAAFSGRLHQTSDLGLPSLPTGIASSGGSAGSAVESIVGLLTANHDARVYVDGPNKARVQLLGQLAEQDVIVNGTNVWTWDSKTHNAVHYILPSKRSASPRPAASETPATPTTIAQKAIAAITPTTTVSKPVSTSVAGQNAWQITLRPKSTGTLVADVILSIDKRTGVPLSARIDAKGQKTAAVSIGYSSIHFSRPPANLFTFTPPSGAHVTTKTVKGHKPGTTKKHPNTMTPGTIQGTTPPSGGHAGHPGRRGPKPAVSGSGWDAIVQLPAGTASALTGSKANGSTSRLFGELTTPVAGGRALQTSLVTVLITPDGLVFAGAVPLQALQAAAG